MFEILYHDTQRIIEFYGVNENGDNRYINHDGRLEEARDFMLEWFDERLREYFAIDDTESIAGDLVNLFMDSAFLNHVGDVISLPNNCLTEDLGVFGESFLEVSSVDYL